MSFDLQGALAVWQHTPIAIDALVRHLPERLLHANEGGETFSPFDVVGHLIDGEETDWMARARIILGDQADRRFAPVDRFRHRTRNAGRDIGGLLDEFAMWRRRNLVELQDWNLGEAELQRTGIHSTFGTVTLDQLLSTWVVHDLGHVAQTARVIAKQHRDDVGPWVAFLPVLTDRPVPAS